jgi:hypothetical protein
VRLCEKESSSGKRGKKHCLCDDQASGGFGVICEY